MDLPDQELERFIDTQLKRLPDREAPENLVESVLARIEMLENRPWWQQPFTEWPRFFQSILILSLTALCWALITALATPLQHLSWTSLYEKALAYSWVLDRARTYGESMYGTLRGVPMMWFLLAGGILASMYFACIAGGMALYRLTVPPGTRRW